MQTAPERALNVALALNATDLVVEAIAGLWSRSLALVSDAVHIARRPPTPAHTFGWARAESLGAFTNALVLTLACGALLFEAGERLVRSAPPMQAEPMLRVALEGAIDLNVRAAMPRTAADVATSAGVLVLVLVGAWSVLRDASRALMQAAPIAPCAAEVEALLPQLQGVEALHDVHVWTQGGGRVIVTAHRVCTEAADERAAIADAARAVRESPPTAHVTLQFERVSACGQPAADARAAHACDASHD